MSTTYIEDWHGFFPANETTQDALVVYQTSLEEEGVLNPKDESGLCELLTRTVSVDGVPYIEAQFSAYREVASGSEDVLALDRRDLAELTKGTMVVRGYDEDTAEVYAFGYVNGESKQGENYCFQAELFRELHRLQFNAVEVTPWKVAEPRRGAERPEQPALHLRQGRAAVGGSSLRQWAHRGSGSVTHGAWWLKPGQRPDFADIPQFLTPSDSGGVTYAWEDLESSWFLHRNRDILINPDFQRGHVWSEDKQIAYIEYCLRGGIGARTIYWNHPDSAHCKPIYSDLKQDQYVLVDGLQRITAVRRWMNNEIPAFGFYLKDWSGWMRTHRCRFLFVINSLATRADLLHWYLQLNDGGVVHSEAELARVRDLLAEALKF